MDANPARNLLVDLAVGMKLLHPGQAFADSLTVALAAHALDAVAANLSDLW